MKYLGLKETETIILDFSSKTPVQTQELFCFTLFYKKVKTSFRVLIFTKNDIDQSLIVLTYEGILQVVYRLSLFLLLM